MLNSFALSLVPDVNECISANPCGVEHLENRECVTVHVNEGTQMTPVEGVKVSYTQKTGIVWTHRMGWHVHVNQGTSTTTPVEDVKVSYIQRTGYV